MKAIKWIGCLLFVLACGMDHSKHLTAREIVDRAIKVAGGDRYTTNRISFDFRDYHYTMVPGPKGRILKRSRVVDSVVVTDIRQGNTFRRLLDGSPVTVPDSMAVRYSNSVNSVHYFAYLPYGLNDPAVNKELLGEVQIDGRPYYKIRVFFDQEGGGKDYQDVFVYWFNRKTFNLDYLAYVYHTDGGGMRFRKAYNERYVGGIRFVDYENYEAHTRVPPSELDSLYQAGQLDWLSKIALKNIAVSPGNYN